MEDDIINTSDLDLTAFLVAQGCEVISIGPGDPPGRQLFVVSGKQVRELSATYLHGEAVLRLDAFLDARRGLLDRLHRAERVR